MSDIISKNKANNIIRIVHHNYNDVDISNTERPDIQYRKHRHGIEVTRAYSKQEGLFYERKIRIIIEDTSAILDRVVSAINKKTQKAPGYIAENPWLKKLSLAIIIGYPLNQNDLETVIGQIPTKTKDYYSEIYFITPISSFYMKIEEF